MWYPKLRLEEAGAEVVVAGSAANTHYNGKHGYPCVSDAAIGEMNAADFDALVVPGGFMPDKLRRDPVVLDLVRAFDEAKNRSRQSVTVVGYRFRPASTAVFVSPVRRESKTTWSMPARLYEDAAVVVDGHHVSSRRPDDLPAFCRAFIAVMQAGTFE